MKIVVLFHKKAPRFRMPSYGVTRLAEVWKKDGHHVRFQFGTREAPWADICFVHVDLTVVPGDYLDYAWKHPIVINGKNSDISRRTYSKHEVGDYDSWNGPVIVKSNDNFGGWPELIHRVPRMIHPLMRFHTRLLEHPNRFYDSLDYQIYDQLEKVPDKYLSDDRFIIEKFLPEIREGMYCMNQYIFFGRFFASHRMSGMHPIVKGSNTVRREVTQPPEEILEAKEKLCLDYGKLDYCIYKGEVALVDVNRTIGFGPYPKSYSLDLEARARGLYDFID